LFPYCISIIIQTAKKREKNQEKKNNGTFLKSTSFEFLILKTNLPFKNKLRKLLPIILVILRKETKIILALPPWYKKPKLLCKDRLYKKHDSIWCFYTFAPTTRTHYYTLHFCISKYYLVVLPIFSWALEYKLIKYDNHCIFQLGIPIICHDIISM